MANANDQFLLNLESSNPLPGGFTAGWQTQSQDDVTDEGGATHGSGGDPTGRWYLDSGGIPYMYQGGPTGSFPDQVPWAGGNLVPYEALKQKNQGAGGFFGPAVDAFKAGGPVPGLILGGLAGPLVFGGDAVGGVASNMALEDAYMGAVPGAADAVSGGAASGLNYTPAPDGNLNPVDELLRRTQPPVNPNFTPAPGGTTSTLDFLKGVSNIPTPQIGGGSEVSGPMIDPSETGAFDAGLFTPQDVGLGTQNAFGEDFAAPSSVVPGGGGPTGGEIPAGSSGSPGVPDPTEEAKRRLGQTTAGAAKAAPSIYQRAIDALTKNPLAAAGLGLNVASQVMNRNKGKDLASQIKAAGAPSAAAAGSLIDKGLSGTPSPASAFEIDKWANNSIEAIKQRYANMGRDAGNDSAAAREIADVKAQQVAMRDKAANDLLAMGLNAQGLAQGPQIQAALAAAQQDKDLAASMGNMLQSMAMLEALSSRGAGAAPATATP